MFDINGTLVIFVASFLLFMVLLKKIMLEPVGKVMAMRQEKMHSDLEAGKKARQEAIGEVEKYEAHLKQIRGQAHSEITNAVGSANKQKTETMAKVHKQGLAELETAKTEIAAERTNLIDGPVSLERELVEEITQKILGEPVAVNIDANKVRKNLEET